MFSFIWNALLKTPLLNLLFLLTRLLGNNLGLGILAFTVFLQLALTPLRLPQLKSAQKLKNIKPELDGLKDKHGNDRQALALAQMEVYKKHGVNPLGGFVPTIVSLVVLIALYRVLFEVISATDIAVINSRLYFDFLKLPDISSLKTSFLWLDVGKPDPYFILPIMVGVTQWLVTKTMAGGQPTGIAKEGEEGKDDIMQAMQGQMQFLFPIMTALITARLPAGVSLYWIVSVVFSIIQNYIALS
ncbi:MAG: membrane protein insertase YidC [Candidatus Cloacimonetes bacterium]|nr:membrane protein insertase YidC [Candidatus Cloacimonadota bacterium]